MQPMSVLISFWRLTSLIFFFFAVLHALWNNLSLPSLIRDCTLTHSFILLFPWLSWGFVNESVSVFLFQLTLLVDFRYSFMRKVVQALQTIYPSELFVSINSYAAHKFILFLPSANRISYKTLFFVIKTNIMIYPCSLLLTELLDPMASTESTFIASTGFSSNVLDSLLQVEGSLNSFN